MQQSIIKPAETDEEILSCFLVMQELRTHLNSPRRFLEQVRMQQSQKYSLLAVWQDSLPVAVAGYRYQLNLIHGSFVYVDDLVTTASMRGQHYGQMLMEHIFYEASNHRCSKVILDTGLANNLAQRFYYRLGMLATGMHFCLTLNEPSQ